MTKPTPGAPALVFHDTTFHPVNRAGQQWLTAAEIAAAMGYASDDAISRIYRRHRDEFTASMALTVNLTVRGSVAPKPVMIFSLRGAHLLGMFARTERAKEFRRWVLDILDRESARKAARQPKALPHRPFDLRGTMLDHHTTPTVPLPPAVQDAINRKAWSMTHDAYELCREHIARRIAYTSEVGKPRRLDEQAALDTIERTTLENALAPTHYNALRSMLRQMETVLAIAQDGVAQVRAEMKKKGVL